METKGPGRTPSWLVVALIALSCVPLSAHLPWWTVTGAGVFVAWRLGERYGLKAPVRVLRWLLVVLVSVLIYARFHTLLGEHPGLSFLVMLIGLKFLEARSARDAVILVLLSYIAWLGDLLLQPTMIMGVLTLAFLIASFVALSQISQAAGLGMRSRIRHSGLLLAQAIPLALIAYVVFPRVAGGLWQAPAAVGQTGLTPILRPGSLSALLSSRKVAMRVIFHGPRPPRDRRYFRAYVLTMTNGRAWRQGPLFGKGHTEGRVFASYTVLLNPTHDHVLPALDWPVKAPAASVLAAGALIRSHRPVNRLLRYRLQAAPLRKSALSAAAYRLNIALPYPVGARIRGLAARLAKNAGPRKTRARVITRRVLNYFVSHHFTYTLNPPAMGRHPVTRFLFHVRAGYCEDYAAAFATLMRAAGVPTRIVVGFSGGEFNPDGNDVIVRNWDAHSWAEVWTAGAWRRVDPTAVVAPGALTERFDTLRQMLAHGAGHFGTYGSFWRTARHHVRLWEDAATTNWDNWVVDYSRRRQRALLKRLGLRGTKPLSLGLAVIVLGFVVLSLIKTLGGRAPKQAPDPARDIYGRYCKKLAALGIRRAVGEGPWDYALRVSLLRPDLKEAITHITQSYVAIRYGLDLGRLKEFKQGVRRFRPGREPRPGS